MCYTCSKRHWKLHLPSPDNRPAAANAAPPSLVKFHNQMHHSLQLQAQAEVLQAESCKVAAAEQRAEAAGACAAEEVKRRAELVQAHAAELTDLQQRLQAAQV